MYKVPVILRKDYIVYFEPSKYGPLIHCDIRTKWSKDVKRGLLYDWNDLRMMHDGRMYALHKHEQGTKHIKFLEMTGFKLLREGKEFDLYYVGETS